MSYWLIDGLQVPTLTLPCVFAGVATEIEVSFVAETGESFPKAYLCMELNEHAGWISARKSGDTDWLEIMGPLDPNCLLGTITGPLQVDIELKIEIPATASDGITSVPIALCSLDGVAAPNPCFSGDPDGSPLWSGEEDELPLWE